MYISQCVPFIFIPGHAGMKGNESTDSLASRFVVDGRSTDCTEFYWEYWME